MLKRRWPITTAVIAALIYGANHYDIRGLEGLRLEPRSEQAGANSGLGFGALGSGSPGLGSTDLSGPGIGWPASYPPSPRLPQTTLPASAGNSAGAVAPIVPPSAVAGGIVPSTSPTEAVPHSPAAGWGNWTQMLSIGEKLGVLEAQSQTPPVVATSQTAGRADVGMNDTIRIASFNLHGFNETKQNDVAIVGVLARLLSQFDVIALQDIRSRRDDVLPNLVSSLNSSGRKYDFMIGPRVGRTEQREQFAFVFDTDRIETDRFQLYTVEDPEDMLYREPLVGWFRTIGPASQNAFTFSLVNMRIDPDLMQRELQALPSLVRAIAGDGRGEDDIILAGDFHASASQLEFLAASGMRIALDGVASNTRGTQLLDNFAFGAASTTEYTGRTGAYDFLRQFNLSLEQAVAVSEHLPIWAEFSIIEGGRPGQVAGNLLPVQRFQNDYH